MNITKAAFVEKFVNRIGQLGTNTESGAVFVGTRPQMGNTAQIFVGMFFLLQRITVVGQSVNFDPIGLNFIFLVAALRCHQSTAYRNRRTGREFFDIFVIGQIIAGNDLNILQTGAVIDFDKRKIFGVTTRSYPSFYQHFRQRPVRRQQFYNLSSF